MIDSTVSTVQVSGHDRNSHRAQWSESPGMMAAWAAVDGWMSLGCRWSGSTRTGCGWPETSCVDCSSTRRASRSCHRSTCWSCSASTDTRPFADRCARRPPYVPINQSISHEMPPAITSLLHVVCTSRGSSSNQSISAAGPRPTSAANPPDDAVAIDRRERQTDGRTLDRLMIITVYYMRDSLKVNE